MDFRESVAGRVVVMVMVATIGGTAAILLVTAEARNLKDHNHNATQQLHLQKDPPPATDSPAGKGNYIVDLDESVVMEARKSRQISLEAHSSSQHFINTKDASDEGSNNLLDGVLAVLRRHLLEYPVDTTHNNDNKVVEELQKDNRENNEVPAPHRIRHRASKRRRRRFDPLQNQDHLESVNPLDNVVIMNDDRNIFLRRPTEQNQESLDLQNHESDITSINGTAEVIKVLRIQDDQNNQISTANYSAGVSSHQWLVVAMVGWSLVGMLLIVLACIAFCYNTTMRPGSHLRCLQEYIDQEPLLMYDPEGHQADDDTYKNEELESKNSDKKDHRLFQMNTDVKKVGFPPLHWLLSNLPPHDHEKTCMDYLDDSCLLDDDRILEYNDSDVHTSHDSLLNSDDPLEHNSEVDVHSASLPRRSLSLTDLTV